MLTLKSDEVNEAQFGFANHLAIVLCFNPIEVSA